MSEMVINAARAMWRKHADEPLQVGKFKEPTDYREYERLGTPAQERLHGYARAALSAALDPEDEELVEHLSQQLTGCIGSVNGRGTARAAIAALKAHALGESDA